MIDWLMMMKMIFWSNWWNEFGRGNRSTRRKPAPAPLCPPQNPTWRPGLESRTAAVGSQRLTAWAMARRAMLFPWPAWGGTDMIRPCRCYCLLIYCKYPAYPTAERSLTVNVSHETGLVLMLPFCSLFLFTWFQVWILSGMNADISRWMMRPLT
jgi:hypothetical protein